jgi:hypothetical protein
MAGFIYPRTVQINRAIPAAATSAAVGVVGYSGMTTQPAPGTAQGEDVLFTRIPASIQAAQTGRKRDSALASDAVFAPTWNIIIPAASLAKGSVRDRDIVIDDEGYRYQVGQAYWNSLGYRLTCVRLEA